MPFNILGMVVFLPFVGAAERALNKLLPDKAPSAMEPVLSKTV
jgi:Na+/phosphate symporter